MRKLAALALIVLAFAGCGSDDEKSSSAAGSAGGAITGPAATTQSTTTETTETATTETAATGEDAEAIADTIRTWLTEGGCELMTD